MHIPEDIYSQIVCFMPIPCVDLLVEDSEGRILLIRRANNPAKGQWWFPGGRVHYLETRAQAAKRKLREECGLNVLQMKELGAYDVILDMDGDADPHHGITTLFHVMINRGGLVTIGAQSIDYDWRTPRKWMSAQLNPFVFEGIRKYSK
jgi:ADP-ribose pyrophosphatase YjhB (NUDIX family)